MTKSQRVRRHPQRGIASFLDAVGAGNVGKFFLSHGSAPFPESERPVPLRAPLHAPRSPSWALAPVLSPRSLRAVVWSGRGSTVRTGGGRIAVGNTHGT